MKLIGIILFFISALFEVHLGRTIAEDQVITTQKILTDQLENDNIFDVTTLYKLQGNKEKDYIDLEVHSRTNARYIPFNINKSTIKGPNNNVDSLDCSFRENDTCTWNIDGWSTDFQYTPLISNYKYESISGRSLHFNQLDSHDRVITIMIWLYESNYGSYIQIYNINSIYNIYSEWPVIVLSYENDMYLKICNKLDLSETDTRCQLVDGFGIHSNYDYLRVVINENDETITIQEENIEYSGIIIKKQTYTFSSILNKYYNRGNENVDILILNYIDARHYSGYIRANCSIAQVAYMNESRPNFIEIDWFIPVNNKVCFSIVNKVINAKLIVSAIFNNDQRIHLTNISSDYTSEWNIATVFFPYLSLPHLMKYEIKLRIEGSMDESRGAKAFLDQIYACDPDGVEDVYTLKERNPMELGDNFGWRRFERRGTTTLRPINIIEDYQLFDEDSTFPSTDFATSEPLINTISSYKPYNIAIHIKDHLLLNGNATCRNGGVLYNGKCACPPGFKGLSCELGCGGNSYGLDCDGVCSKRPSNDGCMGIALCTPYTGCNCAPGFFGESCTSRCEGLRYGNGCEQKCGYCKFDTDTCDRFTGSCEKGCKDGYIFPYCKELYKYMSEKPEALKISYTEAAIRIPLDKVAGVGDPVFYELLYQVVDSEKPWISYSRRRIPSIIKPVISNIRNLTAGVKYHVKVVLVHNDGKFVGDVPVLTIQTKCDNLYPWDYNLNVTEITDISFVAQWAENNNSSSRICKLKKYEIYIQDGWKWINVGNVTEPRFHYHNQPVKLIPEYSYNIKMRPISYYTALPFSKTVTIDVPHTPGSMIMHYDDDYSRIEIISITANSRNISLTWIQYSQLRYSLIDYYIYYKLENYLSCEPQAYENEFSILRPPSSLDDTHNRHTATVRISYLHPSSAVITGLKPNANYSIVVSNQNSTNGIYGRSLRKEHLYYATTLEDVPEVAPSIVESETSITNDSAIFMIDNKNENDRCTLLNGNVLSFYVQLLKSDKTLKFETSDPKLVFEELESDTTYHLEVYYTTSAGRNMSAGRKVNFTTKKSYPIPVTSLTVYKKSNRMLGIRWISNENEKRDKKFLIKYSHNEVQVTNVSEGTRCAPWPEMYCFTIDNLSPRARYTLQVSVANEDYPEGGIPASVTNETSEGLPEEPVSLEIVNMTSSQMSIRWKNPNIFNGILRSFVIRVEEIEAVDMSLCCNTFPSIEYPVLKEEIFYNTTVKNLTPGSTYKVGVAAKTTWFGRDKSITVTLPNDNNHIIRDL